MRLARNTSRFGRGIETIPVPEVVQSIAFDI